MNLTDLELFEIESLLSCKLHNMDLLDTEFDEETDLVTVKNIDFKEILEIVYPERYSINEEGNIILSIHIFKILFLRYFRNNKTITFIKKINI
jgi:hypothetical protein